MKTPIPVTCASGTSPGGRPTTIAAIPLLLLLGAAGTAAAGESHDPMPSLAGGGGLRAALQSGAMVRPAVPLAGSASTAAVGRVSSQMGAMSRQGQIAGWIWDEGGTARQPFLWERGVFTDLDPEGAYAWGSYSMLPVDVNIRGQVVASAVPLPANNDYVRPLLFDHGRVTDLMGSHSGLGVAAAINDRGQVLGVFASGLRLNAFLWENGRWTDLGPTGAPVDGSLPRFAHGLALNQRGDVVAVNEGPGSFLWSRGVVTPLDFDAVGINDRRQIIGNSSARNVLIYRWFVDGVRAYVWEDGERIDLGTLGGDASIACSINDKGQVAGVSLTAAGEQHAFIWEDGHMTDLGGGVPSPMVEDINDNGQVVGFNPESNWLWDQGTAVPIVADPNRQPPPGPHTAIDSHGRVAFNEYYGVNYLQPYVWDDGELVSLAPPSVPTNTRLERAASAGPDRGVTDAPARAVSLAIASANPFSESAALRYAIPQDGHVTVEVFDVRGVRVRGLVDEWQAAGSRMVSWDGQDASGRAVPSGIYISRLRVGGETRTVRMIRGR